MEPLQAARQNVKIFRLHLLFGLLVTVQIGNVIRLQMLRSLDGVQEQTSANISHQANGPLFILPVVKTNVVDHFQVKFKTLASHHAIICIVVQQH